MVFTLLLTVLFLLFFPASHFPKTAAMYCTPTFHFPLSFMIHRKCPLCGIMIKSPIICGPHTLTVLCILDQTYSKRTFKEAVAGGD